MSLTERVRKAIEESGMTRYEIARRTGVQESTLSRFMSGKASLTLDTLDMLAKELGLELTVRGKRRSRK